ncbi:MAG TPA: transglycosylase domain-containing protein, partial [Fimbriimonadaceae bacterium]|nr:transglycosylase domain-containing protein [Fimbriimonadaceae bacterium]
MAKAKRKGKKKSPMGKFKRYLYPVVLILLVGVTFVLVKFGISLFHASKTIENLPEKMAQLRAEPSKIFSADGKLLYTSSEQYRLPVELGEVPPKLRDAVLVAEDKRFYEHQGVDPVGIGRALFNLGKKGGGSTLTMQLSKQLYTSTERSLDRKLNDIALAVMMERRMTKDEIFQLYLNQVYFGSGAYGIKAAAEVFFGKSLDALTLGESALLARCVRLPSTQNPLTNPEAALANRDVVLALLRNEGKISEKEYESALREKLRLKPNPKVTQAKIHAAPYAVQHVLQVLRETRPDIDLNEGGYRIDTTINAEIQEDAEQAVQSLVRRYRRGKVNWGAFLLMDRQGRILAEVGGADYKLNQFNVVSMGKRQPGSAFKPFVYATALANGDLDPDESLSNERHTWRIPGGKPWTPENSNGKYSGRMSVEYAFKHSVNVPAVHVIDKTGPDHVVAYASQVFGFKSRLDPVLPLALGSSAVSPLEMAQAYSVFQSGGDRATPFIISRIQGPE